MDFNVFFNIYRQVMRIYLSIIYDKNRISSAYNCRC